jgi:hypothetical protein
MKETEFRSKLVAELRAQNWHAFPTVADYVKGLPDIYAKSPLPQLPGAWVELKWLPSEPKTKDKQIPLTDLQKFWLIEHRKRGGFAYYAVGWPNTGSRHWTLILGYKNLSMEHQPSLNNASYSFIRSAGEEWGIAKLLTAAINDDMKGLKNGV